MWMNLRGLLPKLLDILFGNHQGELQDSTIADELIWTSAGFCMAA